MSVFISYSHRDATFVDWLATSLVNENVHVWVDRWELRPGDSLIQRIQDAITGAACLCVVLSTSSVSSEWCSKELSVGLIRELEEKRVVVVPILLEDCTIPMFLRDKMYADFRTDRDRGLQELLKAVGGLATDASGRLVTSGEINDWAIDWGDDGTDFSIQIEGVSHSNDQRFSFLWWIRLVANKAATLRFRQFSASGLGWAAKNVALEMCAALRDHKDARLLVEHGKPAETHIVFADSSRPEVYTAFIRVRRVGEDDGNDTLFPLGPIFGQIRDTIVARTRKMTEAESVEYLRVCRTPPPTSR